MIYFVFGVLFTTVVLASLAAVHTAAKEKTMPDNVKFSMPLLIQQFNSGALGIDAADLLAKAGYRLELDKAHNVTAIEKDEQ